MTTVELINTIVEKQYEVSPSIDPMPVADLDFLLPSARDMRQKQIWMEGGNTPQSYVEKYEPFEIRLIDGRAYSQILKGTCNVVDPNVMTFETDVDTNDSITILGAAIGTVHQGASGVKYRIVRKVIVYFEKIESVEYCIYKPDEASITVVAPIVVVL